MSEWQDISTAPRDGTVVLAYDPDWYGVPYPMVFKSPNHKKEGDWVHWFNEIGPFNPTHWQPLPDPPSGEPT